MKPGNIALLVFIAIFMVVLAVNFSQNASIYTDFRTAKESGRKVHIVGEWVNREASEYDSNRDLFTFYMADTTESVELVHYYDPKPNNFDQAEKVVVVGGYDQDRFIADKIVMKCPSKYEETTIVQ
ncbi:MAG: cytochrome c maturation protein CcmE [Bacteroidota bacterium]